MTQPFWQAKRLDEMTEEEWEALCDGCGQCCLNKLIDDETEEIYYTNVACNQLDLKQCHCRHYANRFEVEPDCINLTLENLATISWLPETCAYRLLSEGKPLPSWHPLLVGHKGKMRKANMMVTDYACYEIDVINWEDNILNKPPLKTC